MLSIQLKDFNTSSFRMFHFSSHPTSDERWGEGGHPARLGRPLEGHLQPLADRGEVTGPEPLARHDPDLLVRVLRLRVAGVM